MQFIKNNATMITLALVAILVFANWDSVKAIGSKKATKEDAE